MYIGTNLTPLQPNILIDDERHVRLADFGLANFADTTSASASSAPSGAIRWLAPEVLDPQRFGLELTRHTRASDVYSLASVYWEVSFVISTATEFLTYH